MNKQISHITRRGSHFDLPPQWWTEMLSIQEAEARGSKAQIQLRHLVRLREGHRPGTQWQTACLPYVRP